MKKIKSIILISTLCLMTIFCFTGCGEQETSSDGSTSTTKDTENTTTIHPTTEATTEAPTTKATTETQTTEKNNNGDGLINDAEDAVDDVGNGLKEMLDGDDSKDTDNAPNSKDTNTKNK